jgi:hypothetical protein
MNNRHPHGHLSTTATVEHFAATCFPRPLRFFGRALVTAFLSPHVLRAHAIDSPPVPLAWTARRFMKSLMLLSIHVLPDPAESLSDRRRRLAAQGEGPSSAVDIAVHRALGTENPGKRGAPPAHAVCPHLVASGGPGRRPRA